MLQKARLSESKAAIARAYITEILPKIHMANQIILAADKSPIEVKDSILDPAF
jgi:hypothetical protein